MHRITLATALAFLTAPAIAWAHPALVAANPAADAVVVKPTRLSLTFSEPLVATMSGVDLTMTSMPGMANHQPMPIKGFGTTLEGDGKVLVLTLPRALPAGTYDLSWHAASAPEHATSGQYSFSVK